MEDEPKLDFEVPQPPREERLRRQGRGPYYVAPDSAEPISESIWQRIDPDDVEAATKRANELLRRELSSAERNAPNPPVPIGNFLPVESRAILARVGGRVAKKVLAELNGEAADADEAPATTH